MNQKRRDILYSVFLIAFSITGIIYSEVSIDQRVVQYELARPDRYVQIWFAILLILSVLYLVRSIRNNDKTIPPRIFHITVCVTIGLFLLFLILMPYLGYTIASFIFISSLTFFYNINYSH